MLSTSVVQGSVAVESIGLDEGRDEQEVRSEKTTNRGEGGSEGMRTRRGYVHHFRGVEIGEDRVDSDVQGDETSGEGLSDLDDCGEGGE